MVSPVRDRHPLVVANRAGRFGGSGDAKLLVFPAQPLDPTNCRTG